MRRNWRRKNPNREVIAADELRNTKLKTPLLTMQAGRFVQWGARLRCLRQCNHLTSHEPPRQWRLSARAKTFPAASNFALLFRLYRWAATLAAIHFKISRKENTGM
jgi:hypothetical protein